MSTFGARAHLGKGDVQEGVSSQAGSRAGIRAKADWVKRGMKVSADANKSDTRWMEVYDSAAAAFDAVVESEIAGIQ